jgi:hypothetical protein
VAAYTVDVRPRVRKALRQLDPKVRKDVLAKMRAPASEPRPVGAESLQGHPPWLRVRPDPCRYRRNRGSSSGRLPPTGPVSVPNRDLADLAYPCVDLFAAETASLLAFTGIAADDSEL